MSERAPYIQLIRRRRGQPTHDDVLCRKCFEALPADLRTASADIRTGMSTEIRVWTGSPRCDSCEAGELMKAMGFDPVDAMAEATQDAMLRRQV